MHGDEQSNAQGEHHPAGPASGEGEALGGPFKDHLSPDANDQPVDAPRPDAPQPDLTGASPEDLLQRIADLEDTLATTNDRMLRALADSENTRRRATKDREDANIYGGFRLARDLLPVHDNFERALRSVDDALRESASDFIEGVELTQRELTNALGKHRIVPIHPEIGEKFDADKHQAMFEAPVPGAENGTVIEVMQDGFMCADRLLRAAMVGVARGGGAAPKTDEET